MPAGLTGARGGRQRGRMESMDIAATEKARHRRRRLAALGAAGLVLVVAAVWAALQPPEVWTQAKAAVTAGMDWVRYVEVDPRYFRPAEVGALQADPSRAHA